MRRALLASGALAAALSGCEVVAGIGEKTLVDGGASTHDALSPPPPPPHEAGVDAGLDPDVPCRDQSGFVFCDDFDEDPAGGNPEGTLWSWTNLTDGQMSIDTTHAASAPNSAHFVANPNQDSLAQLGLNGAWTFNSSFRLAFDVRVDGAMDGIGQCGVAQLNVGSLTYNFAFGMGATTILQIWNAAGLRNTVTVSAPAGGWVGKWNRVVLAYDTTNGFSVLVNGVVSGVDATPAGAPGQVKTLIMGNVYVVTPASSALQVELDNVVLRGS